MSVGDCEIEPLGVAFSVQVCGVGEMEVGERQGDFNMGVGGEVAVRGVGE